MQIQPFVLAVAWTCLIVVPQVVTAAPTLAQREGAARAVADHDPLCTAIAPFYWEIGDREGARVAVAQGDGTITAANSMLIASASKWIFGAYLVQKRTDASGKTALSSADLEAVRMRSGYNGLNYGLCLGTGTVGQCFHASAPLRGANDHYSPRDDGAFDYDGGHFQKYAAVDLGLSDKTMGDATLSGSLAQEMDSQLGPGLRFSYDSPQLAGGMRITPLEYAKFLRKLLRFDQAPPLGLKAGALLGQDAVCTRQDRVSCPQARHTPTPKGESWHYSLGHWVEDDPQIGDGAFSSPGAFGFYPWIDASRTWYGIVARQSDITLTNLQPYQDSLRCGRAIRKAWIGAGGP